MVNEIGVYLNLGILSCNLKEGSFQIGRNLIIHPSMICGIKESRKNYFRSQMIDFGNIVKINAGNIFCDYYTTVVSRGDYEFLLEKELVSENVLASGGIL